MLSGRGILRLGNPPDAFALEPDTAVFIPSGTMHSVENTGTEDLELLTGMPRQPVEGANQTYDARRKAWGTSFKLVDHAQ